VSVVANVAINVDSRGVPAKLKQIADRGKEVDRSLNGAAAATTKAGREFKSAGNSASQAAGGFDKLVRGLAGAAAGFATVSTAAALAGKAIETAISRTESERRIQNLANAYGEAAELQDLAAASARKFGQSQTETNQAIATTYARLRPLGATLDEIQSVYNGFNTAARLSGATAAEASASFTQLAQALGSGALRGDEFNSIAEQAPGLLQAISKETGVAVGGLRDYAAEGKITSDVVIRALQRIEREGADALAEALNGPEQKLKDLQNETENLGAEFGKLALPAFISLVEKLTSALEDSRDAMKDLAAAADLTYQAVKPLGDAIAYLVEQGGGIPGMVQAALNGLIPFGRQLTFLTGLAQKFMDVMGLTNQIQMQRAKEGLNAGMESGDTPIYNSRTGKYEWNEQPKAPAAPTVPTRPFKVGDVIDESTVAGGKVGGGGGGNGKAEKPEKSLQQQVAELTAIKQIEQDISNARLAGNEVLQARLEAYKRQLEIKHQGLAPELEALELERNGIQLTETLAKLEKERRGRFDQFLIKEDERIKKQMEIIQNYQEETRMLELQADKGQEFVDKLKQIKTLVEEGGMSFAQAFDEVNRRAAALKEKVDPLKDVFEQMASTAATTFSSAFDAAVDGTENLGMALQNLGLDLLKTISKMLMMYAIAQALGALGGDDGVGVFSFLAKAFGFKGKAKGGPVTGGTPYIVGERGPELFVPKGSGTIVPNDRLGGGVTVGTISIKVENTGEQLTPAAQKQLAGQVQGIVLSTLANERRSGGML
jgi:tape measure domain-containing protein